MLIFLGAILVTTIIIAVSFCNDSGSHKTEKTLASIKRSAPWILFWNSITVSIMLILITVSYFSYVDARTFYDATLEQYSTAIEMYGDKALLDVESAAWTDLKYQGYQENISELIIHLRRKIVNYNETIISKRIMDANPFFSWLIVAPNDNMKIIKMKTAKTGG